MTDLHLLGNSPAIGRGKRIALIQKDFEGKKYNNPPSIGALEGSPITEPSGADRILILYPNPSSGYVSIVKDTTIPESVTIKVTNMSGKIVLIESIEKDIGTYNFPVKLKPGLYIVYILYADLTTITRKLIVIR